ncbi:unnamed protein product [Clonostachys rosea f. rosea IK726]|nr:unnamed protein product [Clonostachys rosea f. rosea IK726]
MGPGSIIALSLECSAGISCLTKSNGNVFVCFEMLKPIQFKMLEPAYIPHATNTSNGTVLGLASEWIQTCCTFHDICRRRGPCESNFLPTRLIDIGHDSSDTWKLVITRGTSMAPVEYIALSYCWGASTQLRLTASTQDSFIKGMPISALTRTHRDLITVARSLGIHWLWIDALCILQDSKSDWTLQSLEMAEIYSNCKLAVAAAASSDSQGGLFRHRQTDGLSPLILRQPNRAYLMHSNNYWGEHLEDCSPLFKRGWALQERLLPKRVLYFSHHQIFFECRFNRACEGFPCGGVGLSNRLENLSFFDRELAGGRGISSQQEQSSTRRVCIWNSMVNKYQACNFTFPSDKLIALSGAVKTIELQTGDKFHAGLWTSRILFYLGWNSRDRGRCRLPEVQTPSWSWMSMRGPIAWETEMEMMLNINLQSAKVPLKETMPLAHVVDISTERRTNGARDQLRIEGSILLKGSLIKARLLCSTSKAENGGGILVVTKYGRYMLSETQEPIYLLEMDMNPCLAEAFPDIDASAMPQGLHSANVSFRGFEEGHEYNLFGHKLNSKGGETTSFRVVPMTAGDIFALPLYAGLTNEGSIMSIVGLIVTQNARQGGNRCMERVGMFRLAARVGITKEDLSISLGTDKRTYRLGGAPEPADITLF